ncbi:MAG: prolyl oligopeptidase family serine peptidase [Acidobacteriota bacterium]
MVRVFSSLLAVWLCSVGTGETQSRRPLRVDDEINRVRISTPAMAPDGLRVVFVRSALNWEENKRESRLFMVPTEGGEPFAFTAGPEDRDPRWSPDGHYIAFLRPDEALHGEKGGKDEEEKKSQIWIISASGGEAFQLTHLLQGVRQFVWAPTSDAVVLAADDPKTEEERKRLKDGEDAIYVFEGPHGQTKRGSWSNIWVVGLSDRKPRQVTREKMRVLDLDVSPDGEEVVLIYRRENARNNDHLAEVGLARLDDGKVERLTENKTPESKARFRPGGRQVSFLAPDESRWELRQPKLFLLDLETREQRLLLHGFEGYIRDYRWPADGARVLLLAGVRTNQSIFELQVSGERRGEVAPLAGAPGTAAEVSFSRDGSRAALVWSDALQPPDLYASRVPAVSPAKRLTDLNPTLRERRLARFQLITWKGKDGLPIEGLLYLPPDQGADEPLPLILHIHGGPAGVYQNAWSGDRHIFAGLGYASLCPNVRGSSAYGDAFLRANVNDIGGGDYEDLMNGVDRLIADGIADPDKLGVRGWSYGGILGGWVITQTDRFKAASLGAMVSDWSSEYGQGFNYDVRLWYIGGDPWSNPAGYRYRSPLTHVQNVSTPTLLLHGEEDITDTIEQSMNFFNALWEKGVPTRFVRFPREPHGLREPRHERTRLVEEIAWMQKYVCRVEWSEPRGEPTEGSASH